MAAPQHGHCFVAWAMATTDATSGSHPPSSLIIRPLRTMTWVNVFEYSVAIKA